MAKNCYKKIVSESGEVFINTFPHETCLDCLDNFLDIFEKKKCPYDGIDRWLGHRVTEKGAVSVCADYGKSKGFIADFDSITGSLKTLCQTRNEILRYRDEESIKRIRRVLHNIRTINAHSLMEMRNIVPESFFRRNMKEALKEASEYINNHSGRTAKSILEIAKDLFSIKTEFSVYDKLIKGDVALNRRPFNIRGVLMTVVYPFFGDFSNKNVFVDVQPYNRSILFDFETIQIAFYHIVENTAKYVKPNTNVIISFPTDTNFQEVVFEMMSLHINSDEVEKIFLEGFSGKQAVNLGQQGEGIGLYRSKKLVEMNKGSLTVIAGDEIRRFENADYSMNKFIFSLPI